MSGKLSKFLATVLSAVLLITVFPISASALTYNDYTYEYVSGGVAITGYNGSSTSITIPTQINGANVTEIADHAFSQGMGANVRNVVLPEHLIRIGQNAFDSNAYLQTVTFNQKLEIIDKSAFYGCSSLTSAPSIQSLKYIGDFAFYECKSLPSFHGYDNLTVIGLLAFYDCINITEVTVPRSITVLPGNTFKRCININKITLYDTLDQVEGSAFDGVAQNVKVEFIGSEASFRNIFFYPGNENVAQTQNITFTEVCNHNYTVGFFEAATCTQEGWMIEQCSYCKIKRETKLPKSENHTYNTYYTIYPGCTSVGIGYEECIHCGFIGANNVVIPPTEHEFSVVKQYVPATTKSSGKWVYGCEWCNTTKTVKIERLGKKLTKAKISVKSGTYTGKAVTPSVTVKLSGKKLKNGTDYKVTYKNNKKIGTATAIIKGKAKYVGTRKVTFKITPKKTKIKKVTSPATKKVKVKWGKVSNSSGYQIVLATNKTFTKNKKVVLVNKKTILSKTITKLKAKKTYYVRLRAYKTVNGKKIFAPYTKISKIKTK